MVVTLFRTREIPVPNDLRADEFGSDQSSFSVAGDDGFGELGLVRVVFRLSFRCRFVRGKLVLDGYTLSVRNHSTARLGDNADLDRK